MSNIVILLDDRNPSASALMDLQKATGKGLAEIRAAITSNLPLLEQEVFNAAFDAHASQIRRVLDAIEAHDIQHRLYELPEGRGYGETADDRWLISMSTLRSILDQADAELDRQLGE